MLFLVRIMILIAPLFVGVVSLFILLEHSVGEVEHLLAHLPPHLVLELLVLEFLLPLVLIALFLLRVSRLLLLTGFDAELRNHLV